MTISHLRIDNRLIHGQVVVKWVPEVAADRLLVVNDKVADDPIQKQLLPQAARGVKTHIVSVAQAAKYCQSDKGQAENIMVIAKLASDALALLEAGVEIDVINVGNQAPRAGTKPVFVTRTIAVTSEDAEVYRRLAQLHPSGLQCRMLPDDKNLDILFLMKKKGL